MILLKILAAIGLGFGLIIRYRRRVAIEDLAMNIQSKSGRNKLKRRRLLISGLGIFCAMALGLTILSLVNGE